MTKNYNLTYSTAAESAVGKFREKVFSKLKEAVDFLIKFEGENENCNISLSNDENFIDYYVNRKVFFKEEREILISTEVRNLLFK